MINSILSIHVKLSVETFIWLKLNYKYSEYKIYVLLLIYIIQE